MKPILEAIGIMLRDRRGQDIIEWALLAAFIALVVIVIVEGFSNPLTVIYGTLLDALRTAGS